MIETIIVTSLSCVTSHHLSIYFRCDSNQYTLQFLLSAPRKSVEEHQDSAGKHLLSFAGGGGDRDDFLFPNLYPKMHFADQL